MDSFILKNADLFGNKTDIYIKSGKIADLGENLSYADAEMLDLHGKAIIPGLIDIHTHGIMGLDTMDREFEKMSRHYAECGTTSFLPTTMSLSFEEIKNTTDAVPQVSGAQILGFHMEGPYFSSKYKGAQNEKYFKNPDMDEFSKLNNISMVTIAPELPGAIDFIKKCNSIVSLGHTACNYEEACEAFDTGAKCVTHAFNGMSPLHHREPALMGAAMDKDAYAQFICDGIHIHGSIIRNMYRLFGKEKMLLISDSMCATGLPDGEYSLGGLPVTVKDSVARTGGSLAGSTATLWKCVKKATEMGIPFKDAVYMASQAPADFLGVKKGRIEIGYDADLLILRENTEIEKVMINGKFF